LICCVIVQAVANSRYAKDTLVIVTEDDCQDGPDHVDSHRATTYFAGPYVEQGAVVSTAYSQINVLRTIEALLGTEHLNLNTAFQPARTDVFDTRGARRFDAHRRLLGGAHRELRLLGSRSRPDGGVQSRALEGPQRQHAVPDAAQPEPRRGRPRQCRTRRLTPPYRRRGSGSDRDF
jgi:hypothetical protein